MVLLVDYPVIDDDSGSKTDGTIINEDVFTAIKESVEDQVHSEVNTLIKPKEITDEVVAARGTEATLSDRLDVSLNTDGTLKSGTIQRLTTDVTVAGTSGGAETDLVTYTLPGSTLLSTGQLLRITVTGTFESNANAKVVKIYVAGTSNITLFSGAHNDGFWRGQFELIRTGATSGLLLSVGVYGTGPVCPTAQANHAVTWTSDNIIKITGAGTATNDITLTAFIVELMS